MVKKWGQRIYLAAIFLFLYLPILVLIVLSFNNSKSRVVWGGFTLKWYASCFTDETIMNAFVTTLQVTLTAAIISTVIGTLAAIGIQCHEKKEPQHHARCHSDVRVLQGDLAGDQIRCIFRIPDGGYHVARRFFHHLFYQRCPASTPCRRCSTRSCARECARNCTPCQPFCFCLHFFCFLS